jgi:DNA polymerase-3 subunit epsilon
VRGQPIIGLFYDTETSGLPDFKSPSDAVHQPHVVQIAAKLVDLNTRVVLDSYEAIVKPDGWVVPEVVAKIHGISTERAITEGIDAKDVFGNFLSLWRKANTRIAHNEGFDAKLLRIALLRHFDREVADAWKTGVAECTADMSTDIVKCPPTPRMIRAGFNKYKKPNLTEAYTFFKGAAFENAHTAMADVDACIEVYFGCKEYHNEAN